MAATPEHIQIDRDGALMVVKLARGKANALHSAMIEELHQALEQAGRDGHIRGIVLGSSRPNFFSAGFDATEVFQYDRETMAVFFSRFIDLYEGLYRFPKPVVAAVSGHAVAGGAILALACDLRVFAIGSFQFALNEINLGIALTPGIIRLATEAMGAGAAHEVLLGGEPIAPERALTLGLAHELVPAENVLDRALERARILAAKPPGAYGTLKGLIRTTAGQASHSGDRDLVPQFLDSWFSAEAQHCRQALLASLRK